MVSEFRVRESTDVWQLEVELNQAHIDGFALVQTIYLSATDSYPERFITIFKRMPTGLP